jgi:hypothetical protein
MYTVVGVDVGDSACELRNKFLSLILRKSDILDKIGIEIVAYGALEQCCG